MEFFQAYEQVPKIKALTKRLVVVQQALQVGAAHLCLQGHECALVSSRGAAVCSAGPCDNMLPRALQALPACHSYRRTLLQCAASAASHQSCRHALGHLPSERIDLKPTTSKP